MIDAVLLFGAMNVAFEFIVLCLIAPRTRLRILGSDAKCLFVHCGLLALNLTIHWGTLIGTMSGIFAFICSMLTIKVARLCFGTISDERYRRGLIRYPSEVLR